MERHLRYFIVVAEELNLSKAAERLHTSQPSLGQQMRDLETEVGVALFNREKNRLTLTVAGSFFVGQARALLQSVESCLQKVKAIGRGEAGTIVIGSSPSGDVKVLPRLMPAFRRNYPGVECTIRSLSSRDELTAALLDRGVDLAFLRAPVSNPELATIPLFSEQFMVVLPASHRMASKEKLSLKDLSDLQFLSNPPVLINPSVLKALYAADIDPYRNKLTWDTRNVMIDLNLIGSGLGFTLLPEYVQQIAPPTVVVRPLDANKIPKIDLLAAFRKDDQSPCLGFLISTIRSIFQH